MLWELEDRRTIPGSLSASGLMGPVLLLAHRICCDIDRNIVLVGAGFAISRRDKCCPTARRRASIV